MSTHRLKKHLQPSFAAHLLKSDQPGVWRYQFRLGEHVLTWADFVLGLSNPEENGYELHDLLSACLNRYPRKAFLFECSPLRQQSRTRMSVLGNRSFTADRKSHGSADLQNFWSWTDVFEFELSPAPFLEAVAANHNPFAEHFKTDTAASAENGSLPAENGSLPRMTSFPNLGGDALLVVPKF